MLIKYFTENLGGNITAAQYGNPNGDGRIRIIDVEPEIPDEPAGDTCDRCGEEHTNVFRKIICAIRSFFNRIIDFFAGLFK